MLLYDIGYIKQNVTAEQVAIDAGCSVKNSRCAATWRGGENTTSVSFKNGRFHDFGANKDGSSIDLYMILHNNCDFNTAVEEMGDRYCPGMKNQIPKNPATATAWEPVNLPKDDEYKTTYEKKVEEGFKVTAIYQYKDKNGAVVYEVHRLEKPGENKVTLPFTPSLNRWRRPDKSQLVLYNLPEVLKPENTTIYLNEGEKAAQACIDHGLCGTTSGGSSSWLPQFAISLFAKDVVILRDNDDAGLEYALTAAYDLLGGEKGPSLVRSLKILTTWTKEKSSDGKKSGGDVADWFDFNEDGKAKERLLKLIDGAPPMTRDKDLKTIKVQLEAAKEREKTKDLKDVVLCAANWLKEPEDQPKVIVDNLLNAGDVGFIVGPSKIRKTFFTMQLALSVATNIDFLGFHVPTFRKVLYLQLEVKPYHFQRRLMQMARSMEIKPDDLGWLYLANMRGMSEGYFNEDALTRLIVEQKPELTIIDPAYLLLGDENDQAEAKEFVKRLARTATKTESAMIAVFHTAKPNLSTGSRAAIDAVCGSNVFGRFADSQIVLSPHENGGDYVVLQTVTRNYKSPADCTIRFDAGRFVQDAAPAVMAKPGKWLKTVGEIDGAKVAAWFEDYGETMNRSMLATCLKAEGVKVQEIDSQIGKLLQAGLIVEETKKGARGARLFHAGGENSQNNDKPPLAEDSDIPQNEDF